LTDREIVERVLEGERDAFSLLVRKYQAMVHGVLFNVTRNTAITEDLAQEAFLEAYSKLITLRDPARFGGWLRSIAYNQGLNWYNRQRGRLLLTEDEAEFKNELSKPAEPSERLEKEERLKVLLSVLDSLSESNRLIITLKYLEGLSNNEIAEFLEIPASTLKVRMHRAINQLRDRALNTLTEGFKDKRLNDDFTESICQRIAEYKRVAGVGVYFHSLMSGELLPREYAYAPPDTPVVRGFNPSTTAEPGPHDNNPLISYADALAQQYEGMCYHLSDGNLVILYGYPETHEDDAIRAAHTAEAIVAEPHLNGKAGIAISACLSCCSEVERCSGVEPPNNGAITSRQQDVALGNSTCGFFSSSAFYSLMGLASAVEDGILVDETAQFLLKEHYRFEEVHVRSQTQGELMAYRLIGALSSEKTRETPHSENLPMVGRHGELQALLEVVERLRLTGSGGIFQITGEAGVGKSRLLASLRARCSDGSLLWLEGESPSYAQKAYAPIIEALQEHFQVERAASSFHAASLLRTLKSIREQASAAALPYFADFLGISCDVDDEKFNTATAEQIRIRTFMFLRDWLRKISEQTAIVWVIEDAHWLDESSKELLQYLARLVEEIPILFIYLQRSGYEHDEQAASIIALEERLRSDYAEEYHEIHLNPLSLSESRLLLQAWLKQKQSNIPAQAQSRLLGRAAGNPLYLREIARSIQQWGVDSVHKIPPTIDRIIRARADSLDPVRKSVLQYSAIVGNTVPVPLLTRAFPEVDIPKTIKILTDAEWLKGINAQPPNDVQPPNNLVRFEHDIFRETLYSSLTRGTRQELHREIAELYVAADSVPPYVAAGSVLPTGKNYGLIAYHYHRAGCDKQACTYALKAAPHHASALEYRQAAQCYRIALAHESVLSDKERYDTYMEFGECLRWLHQMEEAISIYQKAEKLAADETERALAYIGLAHAHDKYIHDWMVDRENAVIYRNKATALVDEHTDTESVVKIFDHDITTDDNFISELFRAHQIIRGRNDERAEVILLFAIAARLYPHDVEKSLTYREQALAIAEKIGDDSLLAHVFHRLATTMLENDRRQALVFAQEALQRYEQMGDIPTIFSIYRTIGRAHFLLGNTDESIAAYEQMLKYDWLFDVWWFGAECLGSLVQSYAQRGDWERARKIFLRMLSLIRKHPNTAQSVTMENAAASLCCGELIRDAYSWMTKNISATIERGCEFVEYLERRGIYGTEMEELSLMHPALAASYLMYYSQKPPDEAVEGLRLFIRNISSLDEHVEYWGYALANIDSEKLKRIFELVVGQASCLPEVKQIGDLFTVEQASSLLEGKEVGSLLEAKRAIRLYKLAPWLQATVYEREESKETGKHLARLGIIAEPCWAVIGPFDVANFDADFEERLLKTVFNVGQTVSLPGELADFPWREANDNLIDGYVDCVKVMNSIDQVYGYALTAINSPSERPAQIRIGYDDCVTVWLNGEKLLERTGGSPCVYDDIAIDTTLQSGQNRLLVKIGNIEPGWGFLIRITDANGIALDDLSYASPVRS